MRPVVWVLAFVGLAIWSLLAWVAYEITDGVVAWINANATPTLNSAKALAAVSGVGKEAAAVAEGLGGGELVGKGADLLLGLFKPAIVVIWALGALVLALGPLALSRMGGLLASRRDWSRH